MLQTSNCSLLIDKLYSPQMVVTANLSTPKGWKAELIWLVNLYWTVCPHKWSPVSYRSSAEQRSSSAKDRRYTAVPRNQPRCIVKPSNMQNCKFTIFRICRIWTATVGRTPYGLSSCRQSDTLECWLLTYDNAGGSGRPSERRSTESDRQRQPVIHGVDWVQLHAAGDFVDRQTHGRPLQQSAFTLCVNHVSAERCMEVNWFTAKWPLFS